jgi:hypothetical protein
MGGRGGAGGSGGTGGGPGPELLVSDGTQNTIYRLDLKGNALGTFPSPVSGTRGVAYDRRTRDGFWVCGEGDRTRVYKVRWTGQVTNVTLMAPLNEVRGLDYYLDPNGLDLVAMVGVNTNNVEVFNTWTASDGALQMSTGQVITSVFQTGFWGTRAVGPPGPTGSFDRWLSRSNGTLEHWFDSSQRTAIVTTMLGALRGLDMAHDGTFWLVVGPKIVHAGAAGATLDSFAAPSADAMGLSLLE